MFISESSPISCSQKGNSNIFVGPHTSHTYQHQPKFNYVMRGIQLHSTAHVAIQLPVPVRIKDVLMLFSTNVPIYIYG